MESHTKFTSYESEVEEIVRARAHCCIGAYHHCCIDSPCVQFTSYEPEVEEMVRDIAVELRRRKHQAPEGINRGMSMAELNVEAMKVRHANKSGG